MIGKTDFRVWAGVFVLVSVAWVGFYPSESLAKKKEVYDPVTERVAFAFYKLGGRMPDFKTWVEKKPDYQDVRSSDREAYLRNEVLGLRQKFAAYDPEVDLIPVRIMADVGVEEIVSTGYDPNEPQRFQMTVSAGAGGVLYFPYEINGQYIAVIANNLEAVLTREVDAELFEELKRGMSYSERDKTASAVLDFLLRPISVDMKHPMMLDGKSQWLMMAEIATFSAKTPDEGDLIWEYRAPWYFSKVEKTVGGLYRE